MSITKKWLAIGAYGLCCVLWGNTAIQIISSASTIKTTQTRFTITRYYGGGSSRAYYINNFDLSPGKLRIINPSTNRELIICGSFDIETNY